MDITIRFAFTHHIPQLDTLGEQLVEVGQEIIEKIDMATQALATHNAAIAAQLGVIAAELEQGLQLLRNSMSDTQRTEILDRLAATTSQLQASTAQLDAQTQQITQIIPDDTPPPPTP